ncbi:unnamed protein product, partial [Hymenolepis diminuta]
VTHKAIFVYPTRTTHACQLPAPTLPAHLLSSSASCSLSSSLGYSLWLPGIHFWSAQLLVFCFTVIVSSYSNSYELVTVIAVVIF